MLPTYIPQTEVIKYQKQLAKDISKIRNQLRKLPLTENFGQSHILILKDKYRSYKYHQATRHLFDTILSFEDTLSDTTDPSYL